MTSISNLAKNWLDLSQEYRPSAFWFWNEHMTEDRMEDMLALMERDNIREVLFHPVHGLTVEYLSEEFFNKYRYALNLAKKHNLKVWVYDEYSWPSGTAGGILLRDYPEYTGWYLAYENNTATPRLAQRLMDGTMGAPWTKNELGYVDTLSEEAMACFIKINYDKIKDECGDLFTEQVVGFFTDEPATMIPFDEGNFWGAPALPWTPKLPEVFEKLNGYDIKPYYSELFAIEENKYKEDYFKVVKHMYCNAYHKQIGDWCKKNNVKYTGHLGEDNVHMQVRFGGSLYESLQHMDEPGVDWLGFGDPDEKYDQEMVASVAKHTGNKKVYMEAYGISDYDLNLGDMYRKWQGFACQRVNDIALMGMQQATNGVRKHTYWPPITEDTPWWGYYSIFRDAATRVQGISNNGKDIRKYAIMYPQYEIEQYSVLNDMGNDPVNTKINNITKAIWESNNQFDWVFPEIIDDAKVVDEKIVFPNAEYDAIIATSDFNYFENTKNKLTELSSKGGNVINSKIEDLTLEQPEWSKCLDIKSEEAYRVYTYKYEDGLLFTVRNTSANASYVTINLNTENKLREWDPQTSKIFKTNNIIEKTLLPHSNIYFSVTKEEIETATNYPTILGKELDASFTLKAKNYNTAPLKNIKAYHNEKGWIDISGAKLNDTPLGKFYSIPLDQLNSGAFPMLTEDFRGYTEINLEANINMAEITKTGLMFEKNYIKSMSVNDVNIDLSKGKSEFIWDYTNTFVDLTDKLILGANKIAFTMVFDKWETTIFSRAFLEFSPLPSVDICVAGDFAFVNDKVYAYSSKEEALPIALKDKGFKYTYGIAVLSGSFNKTSDMKNLKLDIIGNDSAEVIIDGVSAGACICDYVYSIENLANGNHSIEIKITSTSASLMHYEKSNVWGINKIIY